MDGPTIKLFGSRKTDHWQTPKDVYQKLNREFHFDLDPCPLHPRFDGLEHDWKGNIFVNPPYSQVERWLAKAHRELGKEARIIVFLVFANTDTKWFHRYCLGKAELRFIKGRIKFRDAAGRVQNPAMRPSMLVIFRKTRSESLPLRHRDQSSFKAPRANHLIAVEL